MNIPEEVQRLSEFSLLNLTNDCIVLVGGRYEYDSGSPGPRALNKVIWQGTLTDENKNIAWDAIDIGGSWMGYYPICFKLKDSVYITGTRKHCTSGKDFIGHCSCQSCIDITNTFDRYNYKEKKMYLNAYSMSDGLSNLYHPVQIATDKNETFAVLVFNSSFRMDSEVKMLMFTEECGFVQVHYNEQSDKELENVFNRISNGSALLSVGNLSNDYWSRSGRC